MTRDDIKQWMAEAGAGRADPLPLGPGVYERFVDLFAAVSQKAVAAEREACAKVADDIPYYMAHDNEYIALAIRARGQQ